MIGTHLLALIPLIAILLLSLLYRRLGIMHLTGVAYTMVLAFIAVVNGWELLFLPLLFGIGITELLYFVKSMTKGDWI